MYYGYANNGYIVNNKTIESNNQVERLSVIYGINKDGSKGKYVSNNTYDCRTRLWYSTTKSLQAASIVGPYQNTGIINLFFT